MPKFRFDGLVSLVSFTDLGNRPDSKLGGESEMWLLAISCGWMGKPL
jgi:hypothetical protein